MQRMQKLQEMEKMREISTNIKVAKMQGKK